MLWWWVLITISIVSGDIQNYNTPYSPEIEEKVYKETKYSTKDDKSEKNNFLHLEGIIQETEQNKDYDNDEELNTKNKNNESVYEEKSKDGKYNDRGIPTEIQNGNQFISTGKGENNFEMTKRGERLYNFYDPRSMPKTVKSITLEQSKKRYPAFNSWAGKRAAAFNSWGGKRAAAFNSWGGKRAAAFNSWGGKRAAAFNSWGGKRAAAFNSWGGKRDAAFNSWGGKRDAPFNSWGEKRPDAFNSWGGKRVAAFNIWGGKRAAAFNSWGGKRDSAFNSWGGKRDSAFNSWGGKRDHLYQSWQNNYAFDMNGCGENIIVDRKNVKQIDRSDCNPLSIWRGDTCATFHNCQGKIFLDLSTCDTNRWKQWIEFIEQICGRWKEHEQIPFVTLLEQKLREINRQERKDDEYSIKGSKCPYKGENPLNMLLENQPQSIEYNE